MRPRRSAARALAAGVVAGVVAAATVALVPRPAAAQEVAPRPLRLRDIDPRSTLSVLTQFGQMGSTSGLAFPIGISYQLSPEVAFDIEFPFGYVNLPGQTPTPLVGNLGVGAHASKVQRVGESGLLRYGAALEGRAPTAPRTGPGAASLSLLRAVSVYRSDRWTPGSGAVRLSLDAAYAQGRVSAQVEAGGGVVLPLDNRPATLTLHYGLMLAARAWQGLWAMVEVAGAVVAPGVPGNPGGHVLTVAPGLRFDLGGVAPAVYVAFPVMGSVGANRPIVIGLEVASY